MEYVAPGRYLSDQLDFWGGLLFVPLNGFDEGFRPLSLISFSISALITIQPAVSCRWPAPCCLQKGPEDFPSPDFFAFFFKIILLWSFQTGKELMEGEYLLTSV